MSSKVDVDHAGNMVTMRSQTGFLVYVNSALVYRWSKKQTSVELSSFGSEFIAMKQCCEYIRGLCTDDQSRATKQEQANLCAVTVLCAST